MPLYIAITVWTSEYLKDMIEMQLKYKLMQLFPVQETLG